MAKTTNLKLVELFSGIGGFTKGFIDAGYKIEEHYFSEIDKHTIANYKYNFKNARYVGSVVDIRPGDFRNIDILTGGFPCQPFSLAGKRLGFEDTRGTMFFEIIRILMECKPKCVVLENVKGLLNHDNGRTFATIYRLLTEIGYEVECQLLNTKWFLPQNRERIYIVGHLTGKSNPGVFPIGKNEELYNEEKQKSASENPQKSIAKCLNANDRKSWVGNFIEIPKTAKCLTVGGNSGGLNSDMTLIEIGTWRTHKDGNGFRAIKDNVSPTIPARAREDGSGQPVISQGNSIRRLTEIECERLQGFPDNWTEYGNYDGTVKKIPKTQRYKMLGNAVTVKVVEEIAKRIQIINN
ncbi:DNA (cytosine-5-)-methyltransferase [Chryseobacterium oncorhynchi]|uniref:Cytosine-specific methyltransferase n=2 Tax=Chryseobacterium oncorhynchi TaxID=741074 RepID=A0A316WM84_9FLAO|nr:DNA (cytosine-5-)-methyltransferase [Chryseobacterium oncorhynchi]